MPPGLHHSLFCRSRRAHLPSCLINRSLPGFWLHRRMRPHATEDNWTMLRFTALGWNDTICFPGHPKCEHCRWSAWHTNKNDNNLGASVRKWRPHNVIPNCWRAKIGKALTTHLYRWSFAPRHTKTKTPTVNLHEDIHIQIPNFKPTSSPPICENSYQFPSPHPRLLLCQLLPKCWNLNSVLRIKAPVIFLPQLICLQHYKTHFILFFLFTFTAGDVPTL